MKDRRLQALLTGRVSESPQLDLAGFGLTRRQLLKRAVGLGAGLTLTAGILAACEADDDEDDSTGADEEAPDEEETETEEEEPPEDEDTPASEETSEPDDAEDEESTEGESEVQTGGTLNYIILRDPTTLDPHIDDGATSYSFQQNVYDKLVDYDENGEIVASLAEDWEVSDDNLTYTFTIREGVIFHHGGELTADDVAFSFDRILDEETNASLITQLSSVASHEAVDDYTFEATLQEPYAPFLAVLGHWAASIVSREFSEDGVDYQTTMNGTGPFKQEEFETDVRYVMTRHTEYWKPDMPYLDSLELRAIRDDSARIASIQSGDADFITYTPWQVIEELQNDPAYEVFISFQVYNNLRLNHNSPPLDDPRVRQALSYALDRDAIHDIAFGGLGRSITGGLIPSESRWHNESLDGTYTYDPDRARQLLSEAGFDDPSEISLNLRSSSSSVHFDSAEVVAQQLRDLGLNIELEPQDSPTLIERRISGDYQVMFDGLSPNWEDPDFYSTLYQTGADGHAAGADYSNQELDELLQEGRSTLEFEARKEIYRQVEELILEDLPMIFLFYRPQAESMGAHVHGYTHIPNMGARPESYMERLWLDQEG